MIADAVGTPVYVYSTATIRRHVGVFRAAIDGLGRAGTQPLVAFAVKANPNAAVLAVLAALGCGADVVSGGELKRALAAGIAADRIIFSGVGKTAEEMAFALGEGIAQFNLESEEEARTLSEVAVRLGLVAPVALRVNPDVDAGTHAKISTGRSENKFGIAHDLAPAAYARAAALPGLKVQGVAVHIGSQLTDLRPLEIRLRPDRRADRGAACRRPRHRHRRSRRRPRRALRSRQARAAAPALYGADGGARDRRLGRAADLRARPADRRQCRRAADAA